MKFVCAARRQGTAGGNDPADCDYPHCGCDQSTSTRIIPVDKPTAPTGVESEYTWEEVERTKTW